MGFPTQPCTHGLSRYAAYAAFAHHVGLVVAWSPYLDEEGKLADLPVPITALRGAVTAMHKSGPQCRPGTQTSLDAHLAPSDRHPRPPPDYVDLVTPVPDRVDRERRDSQPPRDLITLSLGWCNP